ncbi:M1 family aminopeptidase [Spongiivirga citrea]|uniref:Peptidase M1 membrane alanine aminopeptidase domain-containing protein n=1 Tax=Spongiivirga citrea TaxID=1481457 RepID=A0A6M0CLA7_9FLAO|nr:M1 family aminopeptidase [Spongiivirga citrea]NER18661.1 hypothetical protein [Spongiivirga citrea]
MFKTFFFGELRYSLRQPMVYIFLLIIGLLVFGATASDNVTIGGAVGNVYRNSPYTLGQYTSIMTLFGLLMATAFFNYAALREHNHNFNEILFTTPLGKAGYFFGRFFGALILGTVPMLGIFLGMIIGTYVAPVAGWVDAERYTSFTAEMFINNYFLFILPNMFFAGAIIYGLAKKFKSTVISFVGSLIIVVVYALAGSLTSDIENETIAGLTDIFAISTYDITTKYYTSVERNTLSPGFSGLLLYNRLLWVGIGTIILLLSYFSFSFKEKSKKVKKTVEAKVVKPITAFSLPKATSSFSAKTEWLQFKSFFAVNFLSIVKSVPFKILSLFSVIIIIGDFVAGFEYFGLKSYPLTYKMLDLINENAEIFVTIIVVFFSGELVWRDRGSKINEVIDATPHTSFTSLAAKAISLVGIASIIHIVLIFFSALYQLLNGFTRVEFDVYFLDFLYGNFPLYMVMSGIMIFVQVLLNNRYVGYFIGLLLVYGTRIVFSIIDVESNMLLVFGGPSIRYSDMNSFGPGLKGAIWFNLYWMLFSLVCLFLAGILWNRGLLTGLFDKIKHAKKNISKPIIAGFALSLAAFITVGSYVYYNTQVLNTYRTSDVREELAVKYEKTYKKYDGIPMPKITDAKYNIDIFPKERNAKVNAKLVLTNENEVAIDSLHFILDDDWETELLIPNSTKVLYDEEFGYVIYKLESPLQPEQSLAIEIKNSYTTKGFKNTRGSASIVNNGTFLNNGEILPSFGYQKGGEISDKNTRKKYGLPPKDRTPALSIQDTTLLRKNYITDGTGDYINVESVISTTSDQVAIAPGSLIKKWKKDGRSYYHYKLDQASLNFYSFISADFKIASRKWNGIDIEVYYDEKHPENVERMLDAVQRSLEYYTKNFGPYYHKQCRIIEFPRYASFAQAFPGTMPYSEAIGFVIDLENETENNVVDAVIAHEMGHQYWAHQLLGANMQGGTMLSESFAEYSSLMTMKGISKTPMKMREFLKYDHDRYLRGRTGETEKELPLYKVENQGYIHYGKGSVVLYALQDYIGEEKVNRSLRNFLAEYRYKSDPYPTSLDYLRHLKKVVPDSLNYLITDLFKEITLFDNRLKEASYSKKSNGKYEVSLQIESFKIKADSIGNERKVATKDWIDVGVYADDAEKKLLFEKRIRIDQPKMNVRFEVDTIPAKAAIDPRHLLIDRVYNDNIKRLKTTE